MPQKGLPQTTMNALAAIEEQKKSTPMGEGGTPDPEFKALMTGDLESLPDSGGPMGTIPPSGSTIGPAPPPGWFERLRQNGFQATDEFREMVRLLSFRSRAQQPQAAAPNETGPWPRIIR